MAAPGPDEFAKFQRRMAIRRRFFKVLGALAALIPLALLATSYTMRLMSCSGPETPPPGIELDIDAAGRTAVRGCSDDLEACVRTASDREWNRPGGGHYRAVLHSAAGAPQEAVRAARAVLLANNFVPENP